MMPTRLSPAIDSSPPRSLSPSLEDPFSFSPSLSLPPPYPFRFCLRQMASGDDGTERWCVVIGGRGFAARHLVEKLISYNMFLVRIADMGPTINLDPHEENGTLGQALRSAQAVYVSMDL